MLEEKKTIKKYDAALLAYLMNGNSLDDLEDKKQGIAGIDFPLEGGFSLEDIQ